MLLLELVELRARGWQAVISEAQPQTAKVKVVHSVYTVGAEAELGLRVLITCTLVK